MQAQVGCNERERERERERLTIIACSVQKLLWSKQQLNYGPWRQLGTGGGGGSGGGGFERITFRSFLPLGGAAVGRKDGPPKRRERTKLSTPDKNVERREREDWRRIQILPYLLLLLLYSGV